MKSNHSCNKFCHISSGYSLIELLVAMVIGVVALSATLNMYTNYKDGIRTTENTLAMQSNARFAFEFIAESLRDVGSLGCLSNKQVAIGETVAKKMLDNHFIALTVKNSPLADFHVGKDVEGYDSSGTGWIPSADFGFKPNMDMSSDAIKIVGALGEVYTPQATEILPSDTSVQLSMTGINRVDLVSGGYAVISTCQTAHVFQVTSSDAQIQAGIIAHGASGGIGNEIGSFDRTFNADGSTNTAPFRNIGGSPGTVELRRIATTVYYIAENDAGIPTLYRDMDNESTSLVPGVESMQIEYGVNTQGDRNVADMYLDAGQVEAGPDPILWANVVSVRISLTMRSYDVVYNTAPSKTYSMPLTNGTNSQVVSNDRYARYKFTSTVALRNRMIGRRTGARTL